MIDTLLKQQPNFTAPPCWDEFSLNRKGYFVLTLHRPANVDEESTLTDLIQTIVENSQGLPLVFPIHPRTAKIMERAGINAPES